MYITGVTDITRGHKHYWRHQQHWHRLLKFRTRRHGFKSWLCNSPFSLFTIELIHICHKLNYKNRHVLLLIGKNENKPLRPNGIVVLISSPNYSTRQGLANELKKTLLLRARRYKNILGSQLSSSSLTTPATTTTTSAAKTKEVKIFQPTSIPRYLLLSSTAVLFFFVKYIY